MRTGLLLFLAAGLPHAAILRGTVVEAQTGKALAGALVVLEPVTGTPGEPASVRTSVYGTFEFSRLAGGSYLITASRRGFAPVHYGQRRWKAAGIPITLEPAGSALISVALPRYGAISGFVLDENDVGLPEHEVVAYRATQPPQLAARAQADDRGRYRLSGLEPGKYFVRTVARQYEDAGYLPTFFKQSARVDDAQTVDVELDQETDHVDVQPAPGRLVTISGRIAPPAQANVTLVSDTGAETTLSDAAGNFQFNPAAPGPHELYAQGPSDSRTGEIQAVYQSIFADRDRIDVRLDLRPLPQVQFVFKDTTGQAVSFHSVHVMARRKDLSGAGKTQILELPSDRVQFLPGRWELLLLPATGSFVATVSIARSRGEAGHPEGWNEIALSAGLETVQAVLSATPGAVHGHVIGLRQEPVPGAPVYLEAWDPADRRRLRDLQVARADARGQYRFTDLAPGTYRLLTSFDFEPPDAPFDASGVRTLRVDEARDLAQDLQLSDTR
ncbi:MAG: carboxypeptidase-like regulatory domain-containing protein [Acidobacteriia bacterium]|nr:carboxypeptidase-like regulatory domain-containing protein [Terriglobia bacterium]